MAEPIKKYQCPVCKKTWYHKKTATRCCPNIGYEVWVCPECRKVSEVYDEIKNCRHEAESG